MKSKGFISEGFLAATLARWLLRCFFAVALSLAVASPARADQVETQNGDRYIGKVLSLNASTLVVQNDVLGVVRVPRDKVVAIYFGLNAPVSHGPVSTNAPSAAPAATAGASLPTLSDARPATEADNPFRALAAHTNLIKKIQGQFLGDAGPEANQKFDEMLNDLISGKLNMDDLRAQAQSAADQLRAAKKEAGDDSGMTDSYLKILDQFLKSTPAAAVAKTNAPATAR